MFIYALKLNKHQISFAYMFACLEKSSTLLHIFI